MREVRELRVDNETKLEDKIRREILPCTTHHV
eukprot:CCRYP_007422-RA/>CCRYP_007422-RA protein AED:0.48 eAED:0.48 QI:80/1/1/1/0/0/2/37/31